MFCPGHTMETIEWRGDAGRPRIDRDRGRPMEFQLNRDHAKPLYLQLAEQMQERIRTGSLPTGTKLPPVRSLANDLGLTRLTVHNAYSELQAGGWVEAYVGRGTFVA